MKAFILSFLILCNVQINAQQCNGRYKDYIYEKENLTTVKYGSNEKYDGTTQDLFLDLYTPPNEDTERNRPCIIFCFGGAFVAGSRTSPDMAILASHFARIGYVGVSIDYRLDEQTHMSQGNNEIKAVIRAVQDAKAAIRYLKEKHEEIGIDTHQIFLGGMSAGGVTSLTVAFSDYEEFTPYIQSIVDSLGGYEGTTNTLAHSSEVQGVFNLSGGIYNTEHITDDEKMPMYLNHGTMDEVVPYYKGFPLNGQSKTELYGSGSIFQRVKGLGWDVKIDSFVTEDHPTYINPANFVSRITLISLHMTDYFYPFLKCNQIITQPSGISSTVAGQLEVYPTIFNDKIEIQHGNKNIVSPWKLLDMSGKMYHVPSQVWKEKTTLETQSLSKGMYLLHLDDQSFKLIKK